MKLKIFVIKDFFGSIRFYQNLRYGLKLLEDILKQLTLKGLT